MSTSNIPSADQLAAARTSHWHHDGNPILTINMLRDWLNASGIVLYTQRAPQLTTPAPSFVEAILGAPTSEPTLAETTEPRAMLARVILEGGAIPLNLLGTPGSDTPDFLVSPLAFPYVFTLRGDKGWKQAPETSGPSKVSPLAVNAYTLLAQRAKDHATGMSAYDLTTQLAKEVTESAVLRALNELWQHLRVIPVPQPDGAPTLWELITTRFTKQIKAGANAGQPTALSALISLYLGQAIAATEEEIEVFLSPLAPRSRIREVVNALISARQLETFAVEGRTYTFIPGHMPAFAPAQGAAASAESGESDDLIEVAAAESTESEAENTTGRIGKFVPRPRKVGTGFVRKPDQERRPFDRAAAGSRPTERRPYERSERSDRPARSDRPDRPARTGFDKPWNEDRPRRTSSEGGEDRPRRTFSREGSDERPRRTFGTGKPGFGGKPSFGSKPGFGAKREGSFPRRDSDAPRPRRTFSEGGEDRPRRTFGAQGGEDRPRRTFSREGSDERPRRTFGTGKPAFGGKPGFGAKREGSFPRRDDAGRPGGFAPRKRFDSGEGAERTERPAYRRFDAPRGPRTNDDRPSFGDKKPFNKTSGFGAKREGSFTGGFAGKREGGFAGNRGGGFAGKREGGFAGKREGGFAPKREGGFAGKREGGFAGKREGGFAGKREGGFAGKREGSFGAKREGGYAGKPAGGFSKKPYTKSAATGKPAGTFDKFKGNKKPFGNRPPARKYKPGKEE